MTMVTDPARKRRDDPGDPQKCPIFDYHKVFSSNEDQEWVRKGCTTAGIGCVDCKKHLLKGMLPVMGSLYEKRKELEKSPDSVKEILIEGSARAREIARETLGEVRQAMKIQY